MSLGYGGYMRLSQANDTMLQYNYCCYNVNQDDWRLFQEKCDGIIGIMRNSLVEPEIQRRIRKMPSGRKKMVEERVRREVAISDLLEAHKVEITNASGTWMTSPEGIDIMAIRMIRKLFDEYQDTGIIPEHISWFS